MQKGGVFGDKWMGAHSIGTIFEVAIRSLFGKDLKVKRKTGINNIKTVLIIIRMKLNSFVSAIKLFQ